MIRPTTPEEVQEIVRGQGRVRPIGAGTKTALAAVGEGETVVSLAGLNGLIEYEPDEYTFTAYAGTPVAEIAAALAAHGQYLPFDPLLAAAGATLGGTVAANTAGSGRFRYGGVRDFILGVRFVDGRGQLVRGGGKVVKNASGFDLPKFFVGSLGRYGILTEVTFKVFPRPQAYVTLIARYLKLSQALAAVFALAPTPFEMDALDIAPQADAFDLVIRLGGLPQALPERVGRLERFLRERTAAAEFETIAEAVEGALWADVNKAGWAADAPHLIKVPIAPRQVAALDEGAGGRRYTAGGNVAWLATDNIPLLDARLHELELVGLVLTGALTRDPILGVRQGLVLAERVKGALDPDGRFGPA